MEKDIAHIRALKIVAVIAIFVIIPVTASNVSISEINYEYKSNENYKIDEYLREIVNNQTSNENIPVVIILKEQPVHDISSKIKNEYKKQFEEITKPAKPIYSRINPIIKSKKGNISELVGLEQSLLTEKEKTILAEVGKNIESKTRQMRIDILKQTSPVADRTQAPINKKIKSKGGSIQYSSKILNAIIADVPISYIDELSGDQAIYKIYHDYTLKVNLDISTNASGAHTWWSSGYNGSGMDAAIVDTGIDGNHPALSVDYAAVFHTNAKNIYHGFYADNATNPDDLQGHGTHVAGIVASTDSIYKGQGYGIDKLINAKAGWKATNGGGYMNWGDAMEAFDWAISGNPPNADVTSYSFGNDLSTSGESGFEHFMDAIVYNLDIPVVVANGNNGSESSTVGQPAGAFNILAVGNVNDMNTVTREDDALFSSSSRGPTSDGRIKPDISAPGSYIMSANYNWETGGDFISRTGTSMATPLITGSVLLIMDYKNMRWQPEAIKALLLNTAEDKGTAGPDNDYGFGYVNLSNTFIHRDDVNTGSIDDLPDGSVEKFYKGISNNGDRATLVWNRHVLYNGPNYPTSYLGLSDLDLIMYDEANGAQVSSSSSRVNNIEQVKSNTNYGSAILKINPYGTFPTGITFEEYALAADEPFINVTPPALNIIVSNPENITRGDDFIMNVTVNNSGEINAHDVNASLNLPSGFVIVSGANPQSLGIMNPGGYRNASWMIRAPDVVQTTQYTFNASANSNSYGELYSGSGNNTILVLVRYINGTLLDSINKTGISGGMVSTNTSVSAITDSSGFYSLAVSRGTYNLTAISEPKYYPNNTLTVTTEFSDVVLQDIQLLKKPTGNITGSVTI